MAKVGKLFIISAPSGAGKTTLVNAVLSKLAGSHRLEKVITYTTKQPRPGEIPGKDYIYVSPLEFEQLMNKGFFLETTNALGHYYGTPGDIRHKMLQGISPILIIDREGARQITGQIKDVVLIWIHIKSLEILRKRLVFRGTETPEQIERRLHRAQSEINEEKTMKMYKHHITNDVLEDAITECASIMSAELEKVIIENDENVANMSIRS